MITDTLSFRFEGRTYDARFQKVEAHESETGNAFYVATMVSPSPDYNIPQPFTILINAAQDDINFLHDGINNFEILQTLTGALLRKVDALGIGRY